MLNINKKDELQYIKNFTKETNDGFYYNRIYWYQLHCLWTAYCLHHNLMPDTYEYDTEIQQIFEQIKSQLKEKGLKIRNTQFKSYKEYDLYMGQYLA